MKVLAFGSCMSNLTAIRMAEHFGYERTHNVSHNRSDQFLRHFVDRTQRVIPLELVESIVEYDPADEAKSFEARRLLRNQYAEHIGFHELEDRQRPGKTFFDDLRDEQVDVVLMDNFMDVAARLTGLRGLDEYADTHMFLVAHFYRNAEAVNGLLHYGPYLTPAESAANQLRIFHWLRERQPGAKFFFLPYHSCTSHNAPGCYMRIRGFYEHFSALAADEDIHVLRPLELPMAAMEGEHDWPHFKPQMYTALAGYIHMHTLAGLPKPGMPYVPPPPVHEEESRMIHVD
jgi:hypothetical protein